MLRAMGVEVRLLLNRGQPLPADSLPRAKLASSQPYDVPSGTDSLVARPGTWFLTTIWRFPMTTGNFSIF